MAECQSADIRVIMITGDNTTTARVIASQAGLPDSETLTGDALDQPSDVQLREALPTRHPHPIFRVHAMALTTRQGLCVLANVALTFFWTQTRNDTGTNALLSEEQIRVMVFISWSQVCSV